MPLAGSSSAIDVSSSNDQPQTQQQPTSPTNTIAVVRPMRSQSHHVHSTAITIDPSPTSSQPARAVSANSCSSEESEESLPDSLEEGRAPLLRRPHSHAQQESGGAYGGTIQQEPGDGHQESPHAKPRRKIPRERRKTGIALLLLIFAGALNDLVLSYIHELIPDTDPLPDFAFRNIPYWAAALVVSECLMIASFVCMFIIAIAHKYRWVIFRRIFVIASLLYLGRCLTMFVTQVPVADKNFYCSPKLKPEERTFWAIFSRAMSVLVGLGLEINGRHTLCGDYIYSGHTIVHVICYLFICEYSPRRWRPLHWLFFLVSTVGVISLLVSRGHYSIDIIIAYWITTRVFWLYHTLADLPTLRNDFQGRNKMVKTIWFPLFKYMEGNVQRPLPRKYEIPFPVPSRLKLWWQRRRSSETAQRRDTDRDRLIEV